VERDTPSAPVDDPTPLPEPEPAPVLPPVPAPALPPVAPSVPPMSVPAALVDHARTIAADHHTRTGTPIDPEGLRSRLGVPPQLATAILAQLEGVPA
jgi:hypothetical protein